MGEQPSGLMMVAMRRLSLILTLPFRALMAMSKVALAGLCILSFVTAVTLPLATVMSNAVFAVAATVAEAVFAAPSLLKRQAAKAAPALAQSEAAFAAEQSKRKLAEKSASVAKKETSDALGRLAKSEGKLASMSKELAAKELEIARLANPKVRYRGLEKAVKDVVHESAKKVATLTTRSITADISGMAGQAIPYVGAVAVVSLTAYDLHESCELMKELHELDLAFNPNVAVVDSNDVCGLPVPTVGEILAAAKAAPGKALDAIMAMPTEFDWNAGYEDLKGQFPEFHWKAGWDDFKGYFPEFYWKEGADDLMGRLSGGEP